MKTTTKTILFFITLSFCIVSLQLTLLTIKSRRNTAVSKSYDAGAPAPATLLKVGHYYFTRSPTIITLKGVENSTVDTVSYIVILQEMEKHGGTFKMITDPQLFEIAGPLQSETFYRVVENGGKKRFEFVGKPPTPPRSTESPRTSKEI